jgi:hypothetical protein
VRRFFIAATVAVLAASMSFAVACDDDEPSEEEAMEVLCGDVERLEASLADFDALTGESNLDEVQDARDAVNEAVEDVRSSAEDVADARVDEIESAHESLRDAVDDLDGDQSVAAALDSLREEVAGVSEAREDLFSSLNCS